MSCEENDLDIRMPCKEVVCEEVGLQGRQGVRKIGRRIFIKKNGGEKLWSRKICAYCESQLFAIVNHTKLTSI